MNDIGFSKNSIGSKILFSLIAGGFTPLVIHLILSNVVIANMFITNDSKVMPILGLLRKNGLLILGVSFLIIILLSFQLKKSILAPIKQLENQIVKMSDYNMLSYVDLKGPEEIVSLAEAFNRMVKHINLQKIENDNLKAELENDKSKTDFLANVSHEFRTPLNVLLGILQLFEIYQENNTTLINNIDNIKKHTKTMRQNCYRLLRLINNLIDITKMDTGDFKIHLRNYNVINLVEDITLCAAEYAQIKGVHIEFDTDWEEKIIGCDPDKIERIVLNLLSNAIKSTQSGGKVSVCIHNKEGKVVITVEDTGVGIPHDQLDQIFERFKQADELLKRSHEGSGIGLPIVKRLVEMHRGRIYVKSEYGKGSQFTIELPDEKVDEKYSSESAIEHCYDNRRIERIQVEFSDIYM